MNLVSMYLIHLIVMIVIITTTSPTCNTSSMIQHYYDQHIRQTEMMLISKSSSKIMHISKENNRKITDRFSVVVSAYSGSVDETDSTPNITANNTRPIPNRTCAVSQDLKHLMGETIHVENRGVLTVNDLMNKRYRRRVDIFVGSKHAAISYGVRKKTVTVL